VQPIAEPPIAEAPLTGAALQAVQIVVPCYNEEKRLDVAAFDAYLVGALSVALIFVNDGSRDQTLAVLQDIERRWPNRVRVLDLPQNCGKAEAVRAGMRLGFASPHAHYVGFWDADLATPLEAVHPFVETLERGSTRDMILGSRVQLLGRNIQRKASRHYLGRVFATAASLVLGLPVYDTQCGAKLFRATPLLAKLFDEPFASRWIFDVELIARYLKATGAKDGIYELPLDRWQDVGESKVRPVDFVRAIGELAQIYRRYRVAQRYQRLFDTVTAPFVRYAGAGAIGTALHYTTMVVAIDGLHIAPTTGAVVGATLGALVNYVINYHVTFASTRGHRQSLPRFALVAALGVVVSGVTMKLFTSTTDAHYILAQLVATGVVLVIGFFLNKFWTFGKG
jgi:dolichyl-phosphate beta-glucosyltransferase